jgi:hypothetical protein
MASEWMTGTNDWLASANDIRMDDPKWMTETNELLASANGIQMDDWDKWLISFG